MGNRLFVTAKRWTALLLVAEIGLAGSVSATLLDCGTDLVFLCPRILVSRAT